ncbi:MAG: V-type ATPase subunit [Lachnospiraceae bacterium]|nr:V-type ATPase subunit [Lachnospiraceae bacterium]
MSDKQYYYAVARIRTKELSLLSSSFLEQLLGAKTVAEGLRMLQDKGWDTEQTGSSESERVEKMLQAEKMKTRALIEEMVDDMSVFDVLRLEYDYQNLKAAVKQALTSDEHKDIYTEEGSIPPEVIKEAVAGRDFSELPEKMRGVAEEALDVLLHTHDGQLCDIIIDKAALEAIYEAGKATGSDILKLYGELKVAAADIKIAVRASKTGKDLKFLNTALAECESLNTDTLARAAVEGTENVCEYIALTDYADAADELKESPSAFERWCDNLIIRNIRPEIYHPYTVGPLAAYMIARDNEIKTVRIVMSGKINDLPEQSVRERVREMYV